MTVIIADTTSCLPVEIQHKYRIPVVPQMIHFGEESYTEGEDLNPDDFIALLDEKSAFPKTSAPPPELFASIFAGYQDSGQPILCIHPSSDLSGTVRSAETARLDFPDLDIQILDTRLVASPLGIVVEQAAIQAAQGLPATEILQSAKQLSDRARIFFLVATLDNLAKGGRIGGASALLGNALQIKPILTLEDGRVETFSKERTFSKALERLKELVLDQYPRDRDGYLSIMHAGSHDLAQDLAAVFTKELGTPHPLISYLPPAIITHAGPGSIAVGFFQ